jgi:signal transduction histidine kinase
MRAALPTSGAAASRCASSAARAAYRGAVERGALRGIAIYRIALWCWLTGLVIVDRHDLRRPAVAWSFVALALLVTAVLGLLVIVDADRLLGWPALAAEGVVAVFGQFAGGIAYAHDPLLSGHLLGSAWPLAFVLTVAVVLGPRAGSIAGLLIGAARILQPVTGGLALDELDGGEIASVASTVLLYGLAGLVAGYVLRLLRRSEREVATARARADVATTLHDGVLQTLAVIERRTEDPQLAKLAREQERELREFLFGPVSTRDRARDVGTRLRAAAARCEDTYGVRVEVVVAPDVPPIASDAMEVLEGAVGEALTNAGKHARASRVVVYAEPGDGARPELFVAIRDDGRGFDAQRVALGRGWTGSVEGRVQAFGGRAEVESHLGNGTEVRLWLPT